MSRVEDQCAELSRALGEKYEVIRRIGSGGMADVFLARHATHGALFAVKVLDERLAQDDRVVARFVEEAKLEARLSGHPNIVPVYDIGSADGLHYIVMPYIQGEDLASILRREGPLRPNDAANIVAQVAEALSWAEDKGVVHRDLKPANMRLDTSGRAIVVDFGIAKAAQGSVAVTGLTMPGESLGTPFYMSPEQFLGEACDARSDLYSLGIVFFELLTGQRPFTGDSLPSIQKAHLSATRPSIRSYNSGLPAAFDELVQKLVQIDPANRFQSAKDLVVVLSRLGVNAGRSALLPQFDQTVNSDQTVVSSVPQQSAAVTVRSNRRWQVITAVSLLTITLLVGVAAILVLNRPKKIISGPAGSMVLVPGGDFIFGDDSPMSPNPRKKIALKDFYVDETEVSNAEYKRFCDATGHAPPGSATFLSQPDYPVANVTFEDAQAYAAWAGKRLPTEEEWEKSARGTDGRPYPWGWDAWTQDLPHELQPVDSFEARQSPVGALNMSGNVFEWTQSPFPAGMPEYADMEKQLRTSLFSRKWYSIKGGSFSPRSDPRLLLAYMRRGFPEDQRSAYIGFRCVRDAAGSPLWGRLKSVLAR
jgi:eukaryotic-like serine/threonine-protein kinase